MHESSKFFRELQPPPGGLRRLQRTIEQPNHRAHRSGWHLAAGAVAMSFVALAWLLPGVMTRHRQTAELVSAMRATLTPPANGIEVTDGAAIELPSGQSNVRLYLVQSSAADPSGPTDTR